ncbi:immunity protein [Bifidobacterium asteroides]|uniref:Immunity protein n=2 Tax=Bifidobacterium TaxID=1678 RepID=A0A318MCD2_9BIFI|nr:immunity protein [Bifidobacterium asteroides]
MQPPEEKPIYKRVWFWVVIAVVAILAFAVTAGSDIKLTISAPKIETAGISQQLNKMKKTPKDPETPANPNPDDHQAALAKAQDYSEILHKSKQGIYDELTSEDKYTPEAAQYAIDHLKADYNANALAEAKHYQKRMHMSKRGIYDELTSEDKFTPEAAQYAVDNLKADDNAAAHARAKYCLEIRHESKEGIYYDLTTEDKFTPNVAQHAVDNLKADYNATALAAAKDYKKYTNMSPAEIRHQLASQYGGKFTPEEAAYAVQHLNQ